jgi:Fe-S-cluster containining protein
MNDIGLPDRAMAAVAELDRQVERGSFFTQAVFQRGFSRIEQAETLLSRLVDLLAERGVVEFVDLGLAPTPGGDGSGGDGADSQSGISWPAVTLRVDDPDQGSECESSVDCGARMHICQAVCCRLKFPLSCEEVDSGAVKWDLGHPYIVRHESNGYCTHNDPATGGCLIYGHRPAVCRRYSCAGDTRIWSDFDGMVLNQAWIDEHLATDDLHVAAVVPSMEERRR